LLGLGHRNGALGIGRLTADIEAGSLERGRESGPEEIYVVDY
jgi:hypothetical protein